jgi:hypothetical protein
MVAERGPEEEYFSRRFADLLHVDDSRRLDVLEAVASDSSSAQHIASEVSTAVQMLVYQIDGRHDQKGGAEAFVNRLRGQQGIADELRQLAALLQARTTLRAIPVPGMEDTPLVLHASYGIREVLTAVGWLTADRRTPFQAGVLALPARRTELLFVTLDKSEGYHDRIAYHDYAISAERFHWQTQNSAGPDTSAGRRYLHGAQAGWQFQLFVRVRKGDAYRACGSVLLESAEGDRPMTIIWRLTSSLPAKLFRDFSVLRGV